jgi:hypothetical protein
MRRLRQMQHEAAQAEGAYRSGNDILGSLGVLCGSSLWPRRLKIFCSRQNPKPLTAEIAETRGVRGEIELLIRKELSDVYLADIAKSNSSLGAARMQGNPDRVANRAYKRSWRNYEAFYAAF